ncbi:MAG: hypothetical protein ABSA66_07100 [Roseiarcus sp.]|jgi:hypothetical protein
MIRQALRRRRRRAQRFKDATEIEMRDILSLNNILNIDAAVEVQKMGSLLKLEVVMTAREKIAVFLDRRVGRAYCDDCLSNALDIRPRNQVQQKTSDLACDPHFQRERGFCAGHKRDDKLVIWCKGARP